jgi:hypothetical protein
VKPVLFVPCALVAGAVIATLAIARPSPVVALDVPVVVRGVERSGSATLAMVLGFYGADSTVQKRTDEAFDAGLRNASLKDLAATASRLGYSARIAAPGLDSLVAFLRAGVPPIVCLEPQPGSRAATTTS